MRAETAGAYIITTREGELDHSRKARSPRRLGRAGFAERHLVAVFLGPAGIVLTIMLAFPIIYTLYLSFNEWFASSTIPPHYNGIQNYLRMARDPRFLWALLRTFAYTGLALVFEVCLGTALAIVFNRAFFGRTLIRTIFLLPMVATPVAVGLVWLLMYDPDTGVINYILKLFHLPTGRWVSDPRSVIPSLVLVDIWQWTPLVMLITLAGLTALPIEPFEAAIIDGASGLQVLRYVTLPLLRPYIVVAALFRGIDALKTFDTIYVITKGGPAFASETLNIYIYNNAFEYLHMGYSGAMLVVFFCIVMGLSLFLIALRRSEY